MTDDQVERLLVELVETRNSFREAIDQIKWNRRNTMVQYGMFAIMVVILLMSGFLYVRDQRQNCEFRNLQARIQQQDDEITVQKDC